MAVAFRSIVLLLPRNKNLTGNPGFETAGAGGADVFGSWTETTEGTSSVNDDTSAMDTGAHCCRLDVDASNSLASIKQTILTVGKTYELLFRAKASAICTLRLTNPENNFSLTMSWTRYRKVFTATNAELELRNLIAISKSIYIDNVQVRRLW